jgi:hypothetical protein
VASTGRLPHPVIPRGLVRIGARLPAATTEWRRLKVLETQTVQVPPKLGLARMKLMRHPTSSRMGCD